MKDQDPARALLRDPPTWLERMLAEHLKDPARISLRMLCAAVSRELYGTPDRWQEVEPEVEGRANEEQARNENER